MKFSIITPAYTIAKWLPQTIESILSQQGDFSIEYIIVVNDSPDNTLAIAKEYKQKIEDGSYKIYCNSVSMKVLEFGKPEGTHVAINQGVEHATGDVCNWIGGDDLYEPGAFAAMARVFTARPDIAWLKGLTSTIGEHGERIKPGYCQHYRRDWLRMGVYGMEAYHVEQDSTFWRMELWNKVGPVPIQFQKAGDYWLWIRMARFEHLISMNVPISCFRKREGQQSRLGFTQSLEQRWEARGKRPIGAWIPRLFFWPYFHSPQSIKKILEKLYPFIFPFTPRPYLEIQNGSVVQKNMKTFFVR
ncbi:MAG: glycosyltransferase [Candidatus Adlerbacteria bacterium]